MGNQYEITVLIQIPLEVWLEGARAGSAESLGLALESCRSYLVRLAASEMAPDLGSKGDVADLVQETFLEAARDFQQFTGRTAAEWRGWLRQIFVNNLRHLRRRYRKTAKRTVEKEISLAQLELWGVPLGGLAADDASTPSAHAMKKEQQEIVALALNHLADRDRRLLVMRYQERRTFEEIGQQLGCSAVAAHKAARKALERLRAQLDLSSMAS